MPVRSCQENGKPGFSCGDLKCFTYTSGDEAGRKRAKKKAIAQCIAIGEPPGGGSLDEVEIANLSREIIKDLLQGQKYDIKDNCEGCQ